MDDFGFDGPKRPLVWRILLAPFSLLGRFFERFAAGDDLAGNRGLVGWLYLIFVAPFVWLFTSSFALFLGWSSSRQLTAFFLGVPSFLFALGIVSVFAYGTLTPKRLVNAYKNKLKMAEVAGDFDEAEVYLNKLMRIDQEDLTDRRLEKVVLLEKQDKTAEAIRLLKEMTNPDNPESVVSAGAHIHLAQYYQSKKFLEANRFEEMSPSDKAKFMVSLGLQIKYHYEMALTANPNPDEEMYTHKWLYNFYLKRRDFELAEPHLGYIHDKKPLEFSIPHYAFYTQHIKRPGLADNAADQDAKRLLQLLKDNPSVDRIWSQLSLLHLARKDFTKGIEDLSFAKPTSPEQARALRTLRASLLTQFAIWLKKENPVRSRSQRLETLSASLKIMPLQTTIIEMILLGFPVGEEADNDKWLYDVKANAKVGSPSYYGVNLILGLKASFEGNEELSKQYLDIAKSMSQGMPIVLKTLESATNENTLGDDGKPVNLEELAKLNGSSTVGGIYMILGGHAVSKKDFKRGREFFEKSLKLKPDSTAAMNNLAVCIANADDATEEDLNEALLIVSDAINREPSIENYYESRGSIYLKLNQPEKAILDLERALALGFKNQVVVWKNLVIACRAAGRIEEAEAYERSLKASGVSLDEEATEGDSEPTADANTEASDIDLSSDSTDPATAEAEAKRLEEAGISETGDDLAAENKAAENNQSENGDNSDQ